MVEPRDSRPWPLFVLFLLAFAIRLYLFLDIGYTADDALITFRYAQNLVSGNGFVYNVGERVLGTTTPLFTLLIAGLLKLGCSPFAAAFALNSMADLVTAFVLWRMFSNLPATLGWIPPALFLFSPETLQWSLSGMETELSIACLFAAFLFSARDRWKSAFVAGAIATLVRIDGAAVLVALTAGHVLQRGKLPAIPLCAAAAVLLPWTLFAFSYFGSPVPNSASAKWALSGGHLVAASAGILFRGFLHLHTVGIPFLALALWGTREMVRKRPLEDTPAAPKQGLPGREWLPAVIWTWGYALSYALAAGPMHPWYYAPFYAGYISLVWAGITGIAARFQLRRTAIAAGGFAMVIVLWLSYVRIQPLRYDQEGVNALNREVGLWFAGHAPPDSVVALKDIGFSGYYSRRRILDLAGLVSPDCIPYRARGDFLGPIQAFRPRYFAFSEGQLRSLDLEGAGLPRLYRQAADIRHGGGAYIVYELR